MLKREFEVRRYSEFPKQIVCEDLVMKRFKNQKQAQEYSIKLNREYKTRYYVYTKYLPDENL
jgi:ribosomal 30S subunit maturation factor RimM